MNSPAKQRFTQTPEIIHHTNQIYNDLYYTNGNQNALVVMLVMEVQLSYTFFLKTLKRQPRVGCAMGGRTDCLSAELRCGLRCFG